MKLLSQYSCKKCPIIQRSGHSIFIYHFALFFYLQASTSKQPVLNLKNDKGKVNRSSATVTKAGANIVKHKDNRLTKGNVHGFGNLHPGKGLV